MDRRLLIAAPLLAVAVAALVWVFALRDTTPESRFTAEQSQAIRAASTYLEAASRGDLTAMCRAEAVPPTRDGVVLTVLGPAQGRWADICPQTYDASSLEADRALFTESARSGPRAAKTAGDTVELTYTDAFALTVVREGGRWAVRNTGTVGALITS